MEPGPAPSAPIRYLTNPFRQIRCHYRHVRLQKPQDRVIGLPKKVERKSYAQDESGTIWR